MTAIEFAAPLIEEALFQLLGRDAGSLAPQARAWRRERETVYAAADPSERERGFVELSRRWFDRLDLGRPIRDALGACPCAARALAEVHVRGVVRERDEGSELYAQAARGARLVLCVRPERLGHPAATHELALREFLYADDMLDPSFEYRPDLGLDGGVEPVRRELVRDRFRVVWEARVLGRAARAQGRSDRPTPWPRFQRAFGAADVAQLFDEAWSGRLATQRDLLAQVSAGCAAAQG